MSRRENRLAGDDVLKEMKEIGTYRILSAYTRTSWLVLLVGPKRNLTVPSFLPIPSMSSPLGLTSAVGSVVLNGTLSRGSCSLSLSAIFSLVKDAVEDNTCANGEGALGEICKEVVERPYAEGEDGVRGDVVNEEGALTAKDVRRSSTT